MLVIIRKWSVDEGLRAGATLHTMISSVRLLVTKTLLGLEYHLVTICLSVGGPFGRAICMS